MNAIKLSNYTVKYVFLAFVSIASSLFFIDCTAISDQINELTYSYDEVKIGNQVWMDKNLNVDHFRNGDPIPQAKTKEEWSYAIENKEPAWCYYDNNSSNGSKFGKLYNWYAVIDKRGLAPEGWHVSTDEDWRILNKYLGGYEGKAAHKLKSKSDWKDDDYSTGIGASTRNSTGFSGLPGGACSLDFDFEHLNVIGRFWTCTEQNVDGIILPETPITYSLHNSSPGGVEGAVIGWHGLSVRCVKGNLPKTINNNIVETIETEEEPRELVEGPYKEFNDNYVEYEEEEEIINNNFESENSIEINSSYLKDNGMLIYKSPFYMITTGAFPSENQAKENVNDLRSIGFINTGYLWIPDYSSLSGKKYFSTFIGPFNTEKECRDQFNQLPEQYTNGWYVRFVSR